MKNPEKPTLAIIASQNAVSYILRRRKTDPFSETHAKLCVAYAYLFNVDINKVLEEFGGIQLSEQEIGEIYDGLLRQEAIPA